jgi:lysophospholipase L1-like esterase
MQLGFDGRRDEHARKGHDVNSDPPVCSVRRARARIRLLGRIAGIERGHNMTTGIRADAKWRHAAAILILLAVGNSAVEGTSAASTTTQSTYVALGDSYSSGEGNPGPQATPWLDTSGVASTADDGCHRSAKSYPALVNTWLKSDRTLSQLSFHFVACSGATTGDLWDSGATPNGKESQQLGWTAALARARIVTVSIGGNDLNFSDILTNCVVGPPVHTCDEHSNDGWIADLHKNIEALEPTLVSTYRKIEALAPHAALYVVGYPFLFPPQPSTIQQNVSCPRRADIAPNGIGYLASSEQALAAVISQAASEAKAHFVNPNTPGPSSFSGHSVCAKHPWIIRPHLATNQVFSFHPNAQGQAAFADLVESAIRRSDSVSWIAPKTTSTSTTSTTSGATAPGLAVGDRFNDYCVVAWPTAPEITQNAIVMTMSCQHVPEGQFLFTQVQFGNPRLEMTPSTGEVHVIGKIADIATSDYGYKELVVSASQVILPKTG